MENAGESEFGDYGAAPSREQILEALDHLKGLSDEEKEELRQHLLAGNIAQAQNAPVEEPLTSQFFILLSLLLIIAAIFVFFGYKLYKSLKEKERKRDEKKKLRQQKKKK